MYNKLPQATSHQSQNAYNKIKREIQVQFLQNNFFFYLEIYIVYNILTLH